MTDLATARHAWVTARAGGSSDAESDAAGEYIRLLEDVDCGCEPLWPTGIDSAGCWWHSGAGEYAGAEGLEGAQGAIVGVSRGIGADS